MKVDISRALVSDVFTILHTHIFTIQAHHKFCGELFQCPIQRYTYRVLQTIQMKLILLCVLAEPAILGSTKTALKFKYET